MKMKAAVLYEFNKPLPIEEITVPKPDFGQVLVKIHASGICHTQFDQIKGNYGEDPYLPHLLGHEGAGIVEAIGPGVTHVAPGDRVILSWIKGQGIDAKNPKYYKGDKVINAGFLTTFNEYTLTPENRVTKMHKDMPFDVAALLGCAVPTGLGAVFNESKVKPGSSVAVFGIGGVGLNIVQGASIVSASKIIAIDIHEDKLKLAREFGATHTINAKKKDPVEVIKELTDGKGVEYSFDSAGKKQTMEQAYESTRHPGLVNIVGNPTKNEKISINAVYTHYGRHLIGGLGGHTNPEVDFPRYINLYMDKKLKLDEMITHRYPLEKINDAFKALEKGDVGRPIIEMK